MTDVTGRPSLTEWYERVADLSRGDAFLGAHSVAVGTRCDVLAICCGLNGADREAACLGGLLHDIGKSTALRRQGELHHLTGARYLLAAGETRLASLVAHHSGGRFEAALAGVLLDPYVREESVVADIVDLSDLTTLPTGAAVSVAARRADIKRRYSLDEDSVTALDLYLPEFRVVIDRVLMRIQAGPFKRRLCAQFGLPPTPA